MNHIKVDVQNSIKSYKKKKFVISTYLLSILLLFQSDFLLCSISESFSESSRSSVSNDSDDSMIEDSDDYEMVIQANRLYAERQEEFLREKQERRKLLAEQRKQEEAAYDSTSINIIIASGAGGAVGGSVIGGILSWPVIPAIAVGVGVGILIKGVRDKKRQEALNKFKGDGGDDGDDKDPKDPKDPKKKPILFLGKYEENPKHHQNSKKGIGKPPKNGQKALEESIEVPGKDYRVGIEDGKIIRFNEHRPGKYHGYIEENFKGLDQEARNALYKAGIVKNAKTGRM